MSSTRLAPLIGTAVAVASATVAGFYYGGQSAREAASGYESVTNLLGRPLPPVSVLADDGNTVPMRDLVGGHPTLLVIAGVKDCLGCANFSLEFRILKDRFPGMRTLLVGSGGASSVFRSYFHQERLVDRAFLDPDRSLLRALGRSKEPLVLLAGRSGTILYADDRSGSSSSQYPVSQMLEGLLEAIRLSGECATEVK